MVNTETIFASLNVIVVAREAVRVNEHISRNLSVAKLLLA